MSRAAVLAGRTTADLVRNVFVVLIITGVGRRSGSGRPRASLSTSRPCCSILLFAYALLWGFAVIGLSAPNSETAQVMSFPILFPLTFVSCGVRAGRTMPSWLQAFATYQPVSSPSVPAGP